MHIHKLNVRFTDQLQERLCVFVYRCGEAIKASLFPVFNPRVCSAQSATCQTNTHKTHKSCFSPACL